jgi:hypothetical protein
MFTLAKIPKSVWALYLQLFLPNTMNYFMILQ